MKTDNCSQIFGALPDGKTVEIFALKNSRGAHAKVTSYGATLTELTAPNEQGEFANIVLGFPNLEGYLNCLVYIGSTVGRYANRIAEGKFKLDEKEYTLPRNDNTCTLHGGNSGFNKKIWAANQKDAQTVVFQCESKHMEEGFPGNLKVEVTYRLTDMNQLIIDFQATTDQATIINMTNHSYFNLHGAGIGDVLDHQVMIDADQYIPVDSNLIPTGELKNVDDTPFDFRKFHSISERVKEAGGGYDHNFCLNKPGDIDSLKAEIRASGRRLRVFTTQPGLQVFTSHIFHLFGSEYPYKDFAGLTLETQDFPDSINQPDFPNDTIVRAEKDYTERVIYDFNPAE